ncbi:LexA family protein [Sphingomonas hengshuiensis]|uniref:LexA repressor DNA-binding domain-containing protein n=1 Tax=Sphingomonas hengshuiensis TaxID=1609977 RepID=A0A7U4J9W5_9SPHN|nr:MarR family transcriptional regulator [Sphingomonas hengshuiensis]AJP72941.1 hypothetical protein TS85_15800 [Sphingomonas hengshuiensis]
MLQGAGSLSAAISRKYQVLAFIKMFYLEHGVSPTQGEIAGGMRLSKQRIQALVRQLDSEGLVRRVYGKRRGIMLIGRAKRFSQVDALLQLQDNGWRVNVGELELTPPLPIPSLPLPPQLDHIPDVEIGVGHGGNRRHG